MSGRVLLVESPLAAGYRFGAGHPLNPVRLALTMDCIEACGLLAPGERRVAPPALDEELERVHDPAYVAAVRRMSATGVPEPGAAVWGLDTDDNPVFPGMHEAAAQIAGGSLLAARLVASGDCRHAVHWAGGLHHALRRRAAGFCIYNDAAVAIAELRRQGARVAYVDIDAHHGDGVQWLFYDDPGVLTVSFHETGRYLFPGTGWVHERGAGDAEGTKVNVPLEPFTEDASFLEAFETVLPPLLAAFRPDVLVSQHGCDAHWLDPLADLQLTTRSFEVAAGRLHRLAHTFCGGRWVVLGGGGYAAWQVVPRVWTLTWAVVAGRCPPERLPEAWLDRWRDRSPVLLPERLRDAPDAAPPVPRREAIAARNRRTAAAALEGALAALRPGAGGLRPPAWG